MIQNINVALNDPKYADIFCFYHFSQRSRSGAKQTKISVSLFLIWSFTCRVNGCNSSIRPVLMENQWNGYHTIEIIMLSIGALIILTCKPDGTSPKVLYSMLVCYAVIAIFVLLVRVTS